MQKELHQKSFFGRTLTLLKSLQSLSFMVEAEEFLKSLKPLLNVPKKLDFRTDILIDEKSAFSDKIYRLFPKITITEILYEVNVLEDLRERGS